MRSQNSTFIRKKDLRKWEKAKIEKKYQKICHNEEMIYFNE